MDSIMSTQASNNVPLPRGRRNSNRQQVNVEDMELTGWSPMELVNLNELRQVPIYPTRFAQEEVMRRMGIYDQMDDLLSRMGLRILLDLDEPTYPELTRQLLATLTYEEDEGREDGKLHFRIGATKFSIPFHRFCELYGFPREETLTEPREFLRATLLWKNIARHEPFDPSSARMSKIKNPTIRYAMRLMGNTLFARASPGHSTHDEVAILNEAIGHLLTNHSGKAMPLANYAIDQGSAFVLYLLNIRFNLANYASEGIYVGGMLTPLFRRAGVDLGLYEQLPERTYMDEEYLIRVKTLAGRYNGHSLMYAFNGNDGAPLCCFLPLSRYSHTMSNDGVRFRIPENLYFTVPPPNAYNPAFW